MTREDISEILTILQAASDGYKVHRRSYRAAIKLLKRELHGRKVMGRGEIQALATDLTAKLGLAYAALEDGEFCISGPEKDGVMVVLAEVITFLKRLENF